MENKIKDLFICKSCGGVSSTDMVALAGKIFGK